MHDLVIRNGLVVDGTGAPATHADVAITDGTITEVGAVDGPARQTIDADGRLVTPGFVDIHTHYDGQATWDAELTPSCWHGVTTLVMGNCGVGFAPAAPDRHDWLIGLMEGVEDIPGAALSEGLVWEWETFPEFLDALDRRRFVLDVGTQVPHGAVRAYVMGERGAANEPASSDDIEAMADIVREAMLAGALGFSTSRTLAHRAISGEPVPGTFAAEDELFGIGRVLGELGTGVFELAPAGALGEDLDAPDLEVAWMRRLAAAIDRPICFALNQNNADPTAWRRLLDLATDAAGEGAPVRAQVHARTVSLLLGLDTFHPFHWTPSWGELGILPIAEQAAAMRTPAWRERLLAEMELVDDETFLSYMDPAQAFCMGDPPEYEPTPDQSLVALGRARGVSPWEVAYDHLLSDGGTGLINRPVLNYSNGDLGPTYEMLTNPTTVFGLGDGGAHANQTCDASSTTYLLSHWARDRTRGPRIPLEQAVAKLTSATADTYGLGDRGRLAPGLRGDVNVIDFDRLALHRPTVAHDLPAGGKRLVQRADGYVATIVDGTVTFADGESTGELPGRLLRGSR